MALCYLFFSILSILLNCASAVNYAQFSEPDKINSVHSSNCLLSATRELFDKHSMVTIVNCNVTREPAYTVMKESIKFLLQNAADSANLYSITTGERLDFVPYKTCIANCSNHNEKAKKYKYHPQGLSLTHHYLVFIDEPTKFRASFAQLAKMSDYNISASFFLVITTKVANATKLASHLLRMSYTHGKFIVKILIPVDANIFELYTYNLLSRPSSFCFAAPQVTLLNMCIRGQFVGKSFRINRNMRALNCTLRVFAMRVPPFVISPRTGLEMQVLHEIGIRMNVTYDVDFNKRAENWGDPLPDGNWTGMLQKVFENPVCIGVGGISVTEERIAAFDYSADYFVQKIVWVVPSTERIPNWKLMWRAFDLQTWLVLLALAFLTGFLLYAMSIAEQRQQNVRLHDIGVALLTSFQICISAGVPKLPLGDIVRIMFVLYSIFNICVNSLYQTKLITLLTIPQYEHELRSYDEVAASPIPIGGLRRYKEIFNQPDERSANVFRQYQTVDNAANDTLYYWLLRVAQDRHMITILGKFYAQFHMATYRKVTDAHGSPKVYIVDEVIYVDSIRMIFPKGFPLKTHVDLVISSLLTSGVMEHWKQSYLNIRQMPNREMENDENDEDEDVILTMAHLQGAFLFLIVGNAFAVLIFLVEIGRTQFERRIKERF